MTGVQTCALPISKDIRLRPWPPAGYPGAWSSKRRWSGDQVSPFENMRVLSPPPSEQVRTRLERWLPRRAPWLAAAGIDAHAYDQRGWGASEGPKGHVDRWDDYLDDLGERVAALRALDLSGYARIDLRMRPDGQLFVIEANPNPQLAQGEDFSESARLAGVSYAKLIERIISLGLQWQPSQIGRAHV